MTVETFDLPSARASAMRVAQILLARGSKADAVEVLTVWASARNDADGHKLLAEALRYSSDSPLAKAAFASMEGLAGSEPLLESARAKWTPEVLTRFEEATKKPALGWQAEVGYNNNVRYKNQVFHIQTEDSGVKRPHIITHLFADGGRILKSYKRAYANLIGTDRLSEQVRALMKGQHKEMYIALREGKFDDIIEGRTPGGMETFEAPPNIEVRRRIASRPGEPPPADASGAYSVGVAPASGKHPVAPASTSAPPPSALVGTPASSLKPSSLGIPTLPIPGARRAAEPELEDTGAVPRARLVRARLHVIRAMRDSGVVLHEITSDTASLGGTGDVVIDDLFVGARQALLKFRAGRLYVEESGSQNGVFMRIRRPVELEYGDVFIAGEQVLRVDPTPPPNDGPDASPTYYYSSPKWASTFRVVQLWEGGRTGACFVARTNAVQIGRSGSDLNFSNDYWLSDNHCIVEDQGGFLMLTDLGSRAGTFVRLRGSVRISTGDELLVGRTRLRVEVLERREGGLARAGVQGKPEARSLWVGALSPGAAWACQPFCRARSAEVPAVGAGVSPRIPWGQRDSERPPADSRAFFFGSSSAQAARAAAPRAANSTMRSAASERAFMGRRRL
ncbi:MAG: FHA domain-containing protein [Polyangiaceae bacterium]|nr:FHA domain-containing protein [Polyangiaceae bacterium]